MYIPKVLSSLACLLGSAFTVELCFSNTSDFLAVLQALPDQVPSSSSLQGYLSAFEPPIFVFPTLEAFGIFCALGV